MRDTFCPSLDICAPKPHQRWGPLLYPVPIGFNAFLYVGNTVGGVLVGVSAAVLVAVLVFANTGKMKEWTKEERRLEEEHRRSLSEKEGD